MGRGSGTRCHVDGSQHVVPVAQYGRDGCSRSMAIAEQDLGSEPSVPSDKVVSFSASVCIWSARPALRACRSLSEASSAFLSAMRASRMGEWVGPWEPPSEDCERMWEGRLRVG